MGARWVIPIAAYLLGAVPCGLLVGKAFGGGDIRRSGSGNIGATNVARSLGPAAGVLTLLLDVSKGALSAWVGGALGGGPGGASLAGLAAVLGHVFSVYLGFRGGKGVATGLGVFLILDPRATAVAAMVFVGALGATRRVSVGSMLGSISLPLALHFRGAPPEFLAAAWACCLLIVYRHRDNLTRLIQGTEPRLGEKKT
ncbi:MAG: glycerol-3-phosphate 1-O-acyltransferase PlsY [Acidobacteria bacterium]|nr:glycerol-3-phosphate 1-O-acyltransferase PlsY [Acidobacteriota bacterium]MCI0566769.1 glycerol-3-phosphate 1-O-acyltransferase PlsY [Acidobacteriota bacterium]